MKFRQIGLGVDNLDQAIAAYEQILQIPPIAVFNPPGFAFFNMDGVRLMLEIGAPRSLIYIEVADIHAEVERLTKLGFKIETEPHVVFPDDDGLFDRPGNEMLAFFEDGQGNNIGLMARE